MYRAQENSLGAWYDPLKQAITPTLKEAAKGAIPLAMDVAVPAALDYVDKNRLKIWRKAKPVIERIGQDENIRREAGPVFKRVVKRELGRYGRTTFYPKYGKYAAPSIAVGSGVLAGALGAGFFALKKTKEEDATAAAPFLALAYILHLGGLGLVVTGLGLHFGNKIFSEK